MNLSNRSYDEIRNIVREELVYHDRPSTSTSTSLYLKGLLWVEGALVVLPGVLLGGSFLLYYFRHRWWTEYLHKVMWERRTFLFVATWLGAGTVALTISSLRKNN